MSSPDRRDRPCGPCKKTSNNKHFDCPPRMSDGRLFTDYRSRCDVNFLDLDNGHMDSYTYRQYLINNANEIVESRRKSLYDEVKCGPCVEPYQTGTMLPEHEVDHCDTRTCTRVKGDAWGIGLGRVQGFDETKAPESWSPANCCANSSSYFPPQDIVGPETLNRYSTLGGQPLTGGDPSVFETKS